MKWTTPAALRAQVQKMWDSGRLLTSIVTDESLFPLRLSLKVPTSRELADHFPQVREWIVILEKESTRYRLEWRTVHHRILGENLLPAEVWLDTLDDALSLIGKHREQKKFATLVQTTHAQQPLLVSWLAKRPLRALDLANEWDRLLAVVDWMQRNKRPNIYLRQLDLSRIDTKFLETHRTVLSELFDAALPAETIDHTASGRSGFCRRYGFLDKPQMVRFRLLDPQLACLPNALDHDITLTYRDFARLTIPATTAYITENEVNFLAFPPILNGIVIFGAGYGFEHLALAHWLHKIPLYYWGDIDTHGFAILNQLRTKFPHATSLLMDRETLLTHQRFWGEEQQPRHDRLTLLTESERELYDDICSNHIANALRLEQEHIGFAWVARALTNIL